MGGKAKLVKRGDELDLKAAVDEDARIAGEGRRIARDGDDERQGGSGERARLFERAGARRIDERGVEGGEFVGSQGTAEKVARLGFELAQARRRRRRAGERGDRCGVSVGGENLMAAREPEREGARAAEEVRDFFASASERWAKSASHASPASVACRKPPGGIFTKASPKAMRGGRRSITISP